MANGTERTTVTWYWCSDVFSLPSSIQHKFRAWLYPTCQGHHPPEQYLTAVHLLLLQPNSPRQQKHIYPKIRPAVSRALHHLKDSAGLQRWCIGTDKLLDYCTVNLCIIKVLTADLLTAKEVTVEKLTYGYFYSTKLLTGACLIHSTSCVVGGCSQPPFIFLRLCCCDFPLKC